MGEGTALDERVRAAKAKIEAYAAGEASDLNWQTALQDWAEMNKVRARLATESQLDKLPARISVDDTSSVLEAFRRVVRQVFQQSTDKYTAWLDELLKQRQGAVTAAIAFVEQVLATNSIQLPAVTGPQDVDTTAQQQLLDGWLDAVVDLDVPQLVREATREAQRELTCVTNGVQDFSGEVSIRHVSGDFDEDDGHVTLGPDDFVQVTCHVRPICGSPSFTLELSHLTSDGGPAATAPVTVRVNGHVIRDHFCPRTMHEHDDNKVGVWYYVTDRWEVETSFVVVGENTISVSYCDDGTSLYWLRSLGFHCALSKPPTDVAARDVKAVFDSVIAARLAFEQEQELLLERLLRETSPVLARKMICCQYSKTLAQLVEAQKD